MDLSLLLFLVIFLPTLTGLSTFLIKRENQLIIPIATGFILTFGLSLWIFSRILETPFLHRFDWFPGFTLGWNLDKIGTILMILVVFVSMLVNLFSLHYMRGDPDIKRYFAKLGFFTSSMLGLLAADHVLLLFIFWEMVGFSSYLLIGFWFKEIKNSQAARNAFMTNRIADVGLLIGILLCMNSGITFLSEMSGYGQASILAATCLLIGAMGKSAQFPFHTWLPHAMAGPTPVSALIHAATMVAAGVYLLIRAQFIFPVEILNATAIVGSFTAFVSAYFALTQFDIKKVLAYSTISQLGYMVFAVGVGAFDKGFFHLWTHAFFKAGLFLSAGSVIHAMHILNHDVDAQDMRYMGGLRKMLPLTSVVFLVCMLALAGIPLTTGFLSKDGILSAAASWASHNGSWSYIFVFFGFATVIMTAFYMARQFLLVFTGSFRGGNDSIHEFEPTITLRIPLILLAIGSLVFFYAWNPFAHEIPFLGYLGFIESAHGEVSIALISSISVLLAFLGLLIAYIYFNPKKIASSNFISTQIPTSFLSSISFHGLYLDRVYDLIIVNSVNKLSLLMRFVDQRIIDPFLNAIGVSTVLLGKISAIIDRNLVDGIVNAFAEVSEWIGSFAKKIQSHDIQTQFLWVLFFVILILGWIGFYS